MCLSFLEMYLSKKIKRRGKFNKLEYNHHFQICGAYPLVMIIELLHFSNLLPSVYRNSCAMFEIDKKILTCIQNVEKYSILIFLQLWRQSC